MHTDHIHQTNILLHCLINNICNVRNPILLSLNPPLKYPLLNTTLCFLKLWPLLSTNPPPHRALCRERVRSDEGNGEGWESPVHTAKMEGRCWGKRLSQLGLIQMRRGAFSAADICSAAPLYEALSLARVLGFVLRLSAFVPPPSSPNSAPLPVAVAPPQPCRSPA